MTVSHSPAHPLEMDVADVLTTLLRDGYCVVSDLVSLTDVARLSADLDEQFTATPFCEGGFYGNRTKRFGSVLSGRP